MKGKLTAFLLSGTLVVSGISQIVLADDQIKDPVIEKNDEEILQEETKVNPKLDEDSQKQVDEETLEKEVMLLEEDPIEAVCKIEDTEYETLDEAVLAAEDGQTILLLKNVNTEGLNLNKNLIIDGQGHTITFTKYGIALWGKSLTFNNAVLTMNNIGSTPYTAEWNWMTICASKNSSLTLNNTTMTLDGGNANKHAIYFCSNNKLNLNNSNLTIQNYGQDALEWDGGDGGYNVNIINSTFTSNHCRSGFTGTFYATIDNSIVNVINSLGNGSNGSNFDIKNNSNVKFDGNGSHGLSASTLLINDSYVSGSNNGANGIHVTGTLNIDNESTVDIKNNKCSICSKWTIPGAFYIAGESKIQNCTLNITGNNGSGIYQKGNTLTIESSANVTIMHNFAEKLGYGGGININGSAILPSNIQLYNNHAPIAGDDIYSTGKITFDSVGSNWILDDCTDTIDDWYYDGYNVMDQKEVLTRWNVDGNEKYIEHYDSSRENQILALKAAHTLNYTVKVNYLEMGTNKVLKDSYSSNPIEYGLEFDATSYDKIKIDGYTYVKTEVKSLGSDYSHDQQIAQMSLDEEKAEENSLIFDFIDENKEINVYYKKVEETKKDNSKKKTNTSVQTNAKLYISTAISALSLSGILAILKKRK